MSYPANEFSTLGPKPPIDSSLFSRSEASNRLSHIYVINEEEEKRKTIIHVTLPFQTEKVCVSIPFNINISKHNITSDRKLATSTMFADCASSKTNQSKLQRVNKQATEYRAHKLTGFAINEL